MKIMHLISGGDVGGAKTQVLTMLQELSKYHDATLVCFVEGEFSREAREMGIRTRVIRGNPFSLRKKLLTGLTRNGYELLHCHGAKANLYGTWLRGSLHIPVVTTVHSDPWLDYMGRPLANMTYGVLNRFCMRYRDGWVAVSDAMKDVLIDRGFDGDKIWPIYNGIPFPQRMKCTPRQAYLGGLGLDWNDTNVVFGIAARISPVKDIPTLIKAFAETVKQAPNARLLIAGDGEQRQQMEELAARICPEGTVHFAGWQSDMTSFYHCLDVNMLCSLSETFPYAITEGARMYCPVISTAVGGVPKLVISGETGFLVEVGDWQKMSEYMVQLVRDEGLRHRMGRTLRQKASTEFSSEAMARRQTEIYDEIACRFFRRKQGRYGAVICGAYGKNNAGDDAILLSIIRQLRQEDPCLPICVVTRKPKQTAKMAGVSCVYTFNLPGLHRWMKRSTLYISGGGSLIQNVTSTRSLGYYLAGIRQAKRAGCKVMMYGCGIGPVSGRRSQRYAGKVIGKYVDLITLRDRESQSALEKLGVTGVPVELTADPALLMHGDDGAARRYLEQNGLDPNGKYCMFVLRPWTDIRQRLGDISAAARYVWEQHGLMPLFLSFEPKRDETINRQAAELAGEPCRCLAPVSDPKILSGLVSRMDLVVSMRLHCLIFACGQGRPMAAISYDPKVSGFMEYLGSENCVDLKQADEQTLCCLVDQALADGSNFARQGEHLRNLAKRNGPLAGQLLARQRE